MAEIGRLSPHTLVIFSNVASDVTGRSFVPRDVVTELASKSNSPVLSIFSTQIDTGVIGGAMFNMERVGELIGNLMVALNNGTPLDLDTESSRRLITPMFNWAQIERWGVNPALLPADSVFINRPLTLWGQYKTAVILAGALIAILSTMSIALFLQNRRRTIAEISAREAAAQLLVERDQLEDRVTKRTEHLADALEFNETILLNSPVPMGIYAADGQCIMANEAYAQFVGSTPSALLKQNFYDIPEWRQTGLLNDCVEALEQGTAQRREAHAINSYNGNGVRGVIGLAAGSKATDPMKEQVTYKANVGVGVDSNAVLSPTLNASLAGQSTQLYTPAPSATFAQVGVYGTTKFADNAYAYAGVTSELRGGQALVGGNVGVMIQF